MKRPLIGHWTDNGQTFEPDGPIGLAICWLFAVPIWLLAAAFWLAYLFGGPIIVLGSLAWLMHALF